MLFSFFRFKSRKTLNVMYARNYVVSKLRERRRRGRLKKLRLKLKQKRRFFVKRRFFLGLFFIFKALLYLKKIIFLSRNRNVISGKFFIQLVKNIRLFSRELLDLKTNNFYSFRRFRFGFSAARYEQFFSRYKLRRYKKRRWGAQDVDFILRELRMWGPFWYGLYNHYDRNKFFYYVLIDAYRFGRFGLVFLSLICLFVVFFFLYFIPAIQSVVFFFFVTPVFVLNLFFETILPFFLQTADVLLLIFKKFFLLILKMIFSIQLLPEIIILFAIFLIICLQTRVLSYYDLRYFKKFIIASFGLEKTQLFFERDRMPSILSNRLIQIKQLFVITTFWDISLYFLLTSLLVLIFTGVDFVSSFNFSVSEDFFLLNGMNDKFFGNHFFYDSFTIYSRFFILLASVFFLLIFKTELNTDSKFQRVEFILLFLIGILLSLLMVSASSLLSLFLIIEGLVAVMYVLTAGNFLETNFPISLSLKFRSTEGALKYLITNAVAGSLFLLGSIFLVYSTNGEIYFINLHLLLLPLNINSLPFLSQVGILIGLICIAFTFLFKIGSFPFYSWMVDLYESANLGILSFFILIPKMAILLTIINLQRFLFYHFPLIFSSLFMVFGIISLIVGALLALKQSKINRLIAYSSVSQIGSFLVLLSLITLNLNISYLLPMLFVISYSFVMLQFMSILIGIKRLPFFSSAVLLSDLSFIKNLPVSVQTLFASFIFNLAGVPPFLGWLLKSIVVFTSIFLTFDTFFRLGTNDVFLFSTLSNFELSFLTYFTENILDIKTSFFSLNLTFSFFIVLSIIIFFALTVSVYYSIQIYKIIFSESKSLSLGCSTKTLTYYTSLLLGVTIFVLFFFNMFLILSTLDIFAWTLFLFFF